MVLHCSTSFRLSLKPIGKSPESLEWNLRPFVCWSQLTFPAAFLASSLCMKISKGTVFPDCHREMEMQFFLTERFLSFMPLLFGYCSTFFLKCSSLEEILLTLHNPLKHHVCCEIVSSPPCNTVMSPLLFFLHFKKSKTLLIVQMFFSSWCASS